MLCDGCTFKDTFETRTVCNNRELIKAASNEPDITIFMMFDETLVYCWFFVDEKMPAEAIKQTAGGKH